MAKGVSKELRTEIRKLLGDLINAPEPDSFITSTEGSGSLEVEAMRYLRNKGAFESAGSSGFRITSYGREYWEELTTFPPWYWFKKDFFPATVAFATIATSVSGIVFNALD